IGRLLLALGVLAGGAAVGLAREPQAPQVPPMPAPPLPPAPVPVHAAPACHRDYPCRCHPRHDCRCQEHCDRDCCERLWDWIPFQPNGPCSKCKCQGTILATVAHGHDEDVCCCGSKSGCGPAPCCTPPLYWFFWDMCEARRCSGHYVLSGCAGY